MSKPRNMERTCVFMWLYVLVFWDKCKPRFGGANIWGNPPCVRQNPIQMYTSQSEEHCMASYIADI